MMKLLFALILISSAFAGQISNSIRDAVKETADAYDNALLNAIENVVVNQTKVEPVWFTATKSKSQKVSKKQKLMTFSSVSGSAKLSSAGVFKCEYPGVYLFTFSGLATESSNTYLYMRRNGKKVATLWNKKMPVSKQGQDEISKSVIVEMKKDDTFDMWIYSGGVYDSSGRYTQFIGTRLYPLNE